MPNIQSDILIAWNVEAKSIKEIRPARIFRITTQAGQELILKNLGPGDKRILGLSKTESENRLALEHRVLVHLDKAGIPVAVPLQTQNRTTWITHNNDLYTLSPSLRREGAWHSGDWPVVGPVVGRAIATLHQALATFPNPEGFAKGPWNNDPISMFDRWVPDLFKRLPKAYSASVPSAIQTIEPGYRHTLTNLPQQLIHRDCHIGNVLAEKNKIVGFADFDHLSLGSVTFDLAYFFVHQIDEGIDDPEIYPDWHALMHHILNGYTAQHPLSQREKEALPYMMIFNQILFSNGKLEQNKHKEAHLAVRKLLHICAHLKELTHLFTD